MVLGPWLHALNALGMLPTFGGLCNASNYEVVRQLGSGVKGSVSLVRTADGAVAARKAFMQIPKHQDFGKEVKLQKLAAALQLAPRVLGSCWHDGPFIFSEVMGAPWLDKTLAESYCPPDSLNRSAPQALAPYCNEFSRLLALMDKQGFLQVDWQLDHTMRDGHGAQMVIDFGRVILYNTSLPQGANWCVITSARLRNDGLNLTSEGRSAPPLRSDNRCILRCLLHEQNGTLPRQDGPLKFEFPLRRAAHRSCEQIMDVVRSHQMRSWQVLASAPASLESLKNRYTAFWSVLFPPLVVAK